MQFLSADDVHRFPDYPDGGAHLDLFTMRHLVASVGRPAVVTTGV